MNKKPYWVGPDKTKYPFHVLGERIKSEFPELCGEHIFVQLAALELLEDFYNGTTPCMLPFSFTGENQ